MPRFYKPALAGLLAILVAQACTTTTTARWPDTPIRLGAPLPCELVPKQTFTIAPYVEARFCGKEVAGIGYLFATLDGEHVDFISTWDYRSVSPEGIRQFATPDDVFAAGGSAVYGIPNWGEVACLPSGWETKFSTGYEGTRVWSFDLRPSDCYRRASEREAAAPRHECRFSDMSPAKLTIINDTATPQPIRIQLDDDPSCTYCGVAGTVETQPRIVFEKDTCWVRGRHTVSVEAGEPRLVRSIAFDVGSRTNVVVTIAGFNFVRVDTFNAIPGFR